LEGGGNYGMDAQEVTHRFMVVQAEEIDAGIGKESTLGESQRLRDI